MVVQSVSVQTPADINGYVEHLSELGGNATFAGRAEEHGRFVVLPSPLIQNSYEDALAA